MKILVIDDNELLLESLVLTLESEGIDVLPAVNGNDAIEIYSRMGDAIDALVSDWRLPGFNGIDVFKALRTMNPGVKFFLISGYVDSAVRSQAHGAGIKDVVKKPFRSHDISGMLKNAITEMSLVN